MYPEKERKREIELLALTCAMTPAARERLHRYPPH